MERPRVLILGKLPPPLMGPAIATKILLDSDLNEDFELHHFDTKINSDVADMGRFKWDKINSIRNLYKRFDSEITRIKPQLVLIPIGQTTAGFFKDIPLIKKAANSGAKVVVQLRGSEFKTWFDSLDTLRKRMVLASLNRCSGVIVLGDNLRSLFKGLVDDEKIFVVSNGGDYDFPERKSGALRILYLANYLPGKGINELLKALVMLNSRGVEFDFQGYGSWDNEEYKAECVQLTSGFSNITLNGSISGEAKWQALADADIFVFAPKAPEGHPWSLVEASAAGLPIISTDRGAIRQNVIDRENGFLLENPEPNIIAERLAELLENPQLQQKMGEASRRLYESNFTSSSMTTKMKSVFQTILDKSCVE